MNEHLLPGDLQKVTELIQRIPIALLTTFDHDGNFHTRPLQTLQVEPEGAFWFFTDWNSHKVDELQHDVRVSLTYADPSSSTYVAIRGTGTLLRDREKARHLWAMEQRAYYPQGPEDPRLALLKVQLEHAEYWIAPGRLSYFVAAAKAAVTGKPVAVLGENQTVEGARDG